MLLCMASHLVRVFMLCMCSVLPIAIFIISFSPVDPPAVMLRLEAASLSSSSPSSPSFHVDLHDLLLENLTLLSPDHPFLCSSIANLPEGVGVATMSSLGVKYHHEIKVCDN